MPIYRYIYDSQQLKSNNFKSSTKKGLKMAELEAFYCKINKDLKDQLRKRASNERKSMVCLIQELLTVGLQTTRRVDEDNISKLVDAAQRFNDGR